MTKHAKKKLKFEVRKAMRIYYDSGFTNTANKVLSRILAAIDKVYAEK